MCWGLNRHTILLNLLSKYAYNTYSDNADKQWYRYILHELETLLLAQQTGMERGIFNYVSSSKALYHGIHSTISSMSRHWKQEGVFPYAIYMHNSSIFSFSGERVIFSYEGSRVLFVRSYMGTIMYSGKCTLNWSIVVSPIFSINITVHRLRFVLLTHDLYLIVEKVAPSFILQFREYGHPRPSTIYISGYAARVDLVVSKAQSQHEMHLTYQSMHKMSPKFNVTTIKKFDMKQHYFIWPVRLFGMRRPRQELHRIGTSNFYMLSFMITTAWMHHLNLSITIKCRNERYFDVDMIGFIDGPWEYSDSQSLPLEVIDIRGCTCTAEIATYRQTTLNIGGMIFGSSKQVSMIHISIAYANLPVVCVPPTCYTHTKQLLSGQILNQRVSSSLTAFHNYTFYVDESSKHQMSLRITLLNQHGYNIHYCAYGGIILAYKGSLHHRYFVELGLYCSPGAIAGLLAVAKPLYLSKGSMSIIVKTYNGLFGVDTIFSVLSSERSGVVSSLIDHSNFEELKAMQSVYEITGPWYINHWCCDPYTRNKIVIVKYKYNIIRTEGHYLHYQEIPSDHRRMVHIKMNPLGPGSYNNLSFEMNWPHYLSLIFTSQKSTVDQSVSDDLYLKTRPSTAVASRYMITIHDPNNITNQTTCQLSFDLAYYFKPEFNTILFNTKSNTFPVRSSQIYFSTDNGNSIQLDNILEFSVTGKSTRCSWTGLAMSIAIEDTTWKCVATMYNQLLQNEHTEWFDPWRVVPTCANVTLKYSPEHTQHRWNTQDVIKKGRTLQLPVNMQAHEAIPIWIFATQYLHSLSWKKHNVYNSKTDLLLCISGSSKCVYGIPSKSNYFAYPST